jgi:NAD(P)-dependent dehydrogenase (short-subunit alcohol dehydrogenase family)
MSGRFEGRVALVTGAASGIGRAVVRRISAEGGAVVVSDLRPDAAAAVADELAATGGRALAVTLDVTDEAAWEAAVAETLRVLGRLDVLVNNAGVLDLASIETQSFDAYSRVVGVMQHGVFLGMRAAAAPLAEVRGAVVNVSSIAGVVGLPGPSPAYHAAKGAVGSMSRGTAVAWGPLGVRVNTVHPGFVRTPLLGDADVSPLTDTIPIARVAQPDEIAAAIAFLASDDASYITGTSLIVDGGYTAV